MTLFSKSHSFLDLFDNNFLDEIKEFIEYFFFLSNHLFTFIYYGSYIFISSFRIFFQTMPSLVSKNGDFLKIIS